MAKDFAFQFCPGDYLRDTQCLSEKAQVAYDRIMCEHIRNVSTDILSIWIAHEKVSFFAKRLNDDERAELFHVLREVGGKNGGFQIEWVAEKVAERQSYIESRTINGTQKKNKSGNKHMQSTKKAKGKLPDSDSNSDIDSNISTDQDSKKNAPKKFQSEVSEVIAELNTLASRSFDPLSKIAYSHISARLKEGSSVDDLKKVIQLKVYEWNEKPDMRQWLRPQTLFGAEKFETYITEVRDHIRNGTKPKKGGASNSGLKTSEELMEEIRIHRLKKQQL